MTARQQIAAQFVDFPQENNIGSPRGDAVFDIKPPGDQ
jgi:hypothetical protein